MKYNDYPLPNEKLVNLLSTQYAKPQNLTEQKIEILQQKQNLTKVARLINNQLEQIKQLKSFGELEVEINSHLQALSNMGVNCANYEVKNTPYPILQSEILLELIDLLYTQNCKFSYRKLHKILFEQAKIFNVLAKNFT